MSAEQAWSGLVSSAVDTSDFLDEIIIMHVISDEE